MNNPLLPLISVIVPVYNGQERIAICLESLMNQDYPNDRYEIVVINNASTDQTKQIVESYQTKALCSIRCPYEENKGLSFARNRGIEEAKGEIISFTDDDCVAHPGWLKALARTFSKHKADAVLGKIVLGTAIPAHIWYPRWFIESRFAHVDYGQKEFRMVKENLVGANMSYRAEIFKKYGKFNTRHIYHLNDDTEFSKRISQNGIAKIYSPDAVIYHHFSPDRLEEKKIFRQSYYWGRAAVYNEPVEISRVRYFLYCLKRIVQHTAAIFVTYLNNDYKQRFFLKCKRCANWGRCVELLNSHFLKKNHFVSLRGAKRRSNLY